MIDATKKWIFLKISAATLVPLMLWFIINAYFFSALSISEVFEDYITNDKIKNVANKLLYASAVVIPSITIILITRL